MARGPEQHPNRTPAQSPGEPGLDKRIRGLSMLSNQFAAQGDGYAKERDLAYLELLRRLGLTSTGQDGRLAELRQDGTLRGEARAQITLLTKEPKER